MSVRRFVQAVCACALVCALAPRVSASETRDALASFRAQLARIERRPADLDERTVGELGLAVGDLRLLWVAEPERAHDIAAALLDLVGVTLVNYRPARRETIDPAWSSLRESAADALTKRLDG